MTCIHVKLHGPCFKTGQVDGLQDTTDYRQQYTEDKQTFIYNIKETQKESPQRDIKAAHHVHHTKSVGLRRHAQQFTRSTSWSITGTHPRTENLTFLMTVD